MKRIFFLLIVTGTAFSANAQTFGIKGGVNLANTQTTELDVNRSGDMVIDFHLGAFANFELNDIISIQPELLYSREGSANDDFLNERVRFQMNFMQVPILVKLAVADGFTIHLGPQTGFLVSRKLKSDAVTLDIEENVYQNIVFSAVAGAGLELNEKVGIGGRYNHGLTDWEKDRSEDTRGLGTRGNVVQFYITYSFQ